MTFEQWLESSKGGEQFVYCTRHVLDCKTPPDIQARALLARLAFAKGQIELIQKRTNGKDSPFDYIAVKRKVGRQPLVHGNSWLPKITQQTRGWT